MPPLNSLSLGQQQQQQHTFQSPTNPQQFYQASPPIAPMSPPVEARVQSWAREDDAQPPEQPQPRASMMWNPEMGIKFGPSPAGAGGQGPSAPGGRGQGGQWDPSAGIRFG